MKTIRMRKLLPLIILAVCFNLTFTSCGSRAIPSTNTPTPTDTPVPPSPTPTPAPTPTPLPLPISAEESIRLLNEWQFHCVLGITGRVIWDTNRLVSADGEIQLGFIMRNPPLMTLGEVGKETYFKFGQPMPRGDSPAVVVFVTSEFSNGHGNIPLFTPVMTDEVVSTTIDNEDYVITYLSVQNFSDYNGNYDFRLGVPNHPGVLGFDTNIFYDGSEHHIYGQVELFGVAFNNDAQEPLIFRISGDRYNYVSGVGTATTADDESISLGE